MLGNTQNGGEQGCGLPCAPQRVGVTERLADVIEKQKCAEEYLLASCSRVGIVDCDNPNYQNVVRSPGIIGLIEDMSDRAAFLCALTKKIDDEL